MHFFSDQMKLTAEDTVHVSKSSECRNIRFLEHVQVRVNLEVCQDLLLTLESPSKTFSRLTQYWLLDRLHGHSTNLTDWVILTLHHWGEDPQGSWKLRAELGSGGNVTLPILLIWKFVIISFCTQDMSVWSELKLLIYAPWWTLKPPGSQKPNLSMDKTKFLLDRWGRDRQNANYTRTGSILVFNLN